MEYPEEMMDKLSKMELHLRWVLSSCIIADEAAFLGLPQFTRDEIFRWQENLHNRAQHFGIIGGHH